jgi:hypothetical protein
MTSRPGITWRSIAIGLLGVVAVSLATPFNDYLMGNTPLVGNALPLVAVLTLLGLAVLVNGPLSRRESRHTFSAAEFTVILSLLLVGCALPSSGLMRYLPGALVTPLARAEEDLAWRGVYQGLDLPAWLLPELSSEDPLERSTDPVIRGFRGRWSSQVLETPHQGWLPMPYAAWVRPVAAWGVFFGALGLGLVCLVAIVRMQWVENERLSFPLATVHLALIEPPERGRWLNATLSSRAFWIAAGAVVTLRVWNGLGIYLPKFVPQLPTSYNLQGLFTESALANAWELHTGTVYFIVIGTTYFLSSSLAFSLWFFVVVKNLAYAVHGAMAGDWAYPGMWDHHAGGVAAFVLTMAWVGRRHWAMVIRHAIGRRRAGEPSEPYLPYPLAVWVLVGCAITLVTWLSFAGLPVWGAAILVVLLFTLGLVITRVIAETGLIYGQLLVPTYKPWQMLLWYGGGKPVSSEAFMVTAMVQVTTYDYREPLPVYVSHAMKVNDSAGAGGTRAAPARSLLAWMAVAWILGYVLSFGSTLWMHYNHEMTLVGTGTLVNDWGSSLAPRVYVTNPTTAFAEGRATQPWDPGLHMAAGFAFTLLLGWLRCVYTWWPFHPIGFLMMPTSPARLMAFSIFLGWGLKVVIVRYGGSGMYRAAMPLFLGLVVGDCLGAGFWVVANAVIYLAGGQYQPVLIMPE